MNYISYNLVIFNNFSILIRDNGSLERLYLCKCMLVYDRLWKIKRDLIKREIQMTNITKMHSDSFNYFFNFGDIGF